MTEIDYRAHPERYKIGRGEEGVFHVQPYKTELLPLWKFATPDVARESAHKLWAKYEEYKSVGDFVGMDMARKYLQMGYTRSRRYANHKGGRKYDADGSVRPFDGDPQKAECAAIFKEFWDRVLADEEYQRRREEHHPKKRG